MLRDSIQIAICGLISLTVSACTAVKPVIVDRFEHTKLKHLHIKADPYIEYRFAGELNRILSGYLVGDDAYVITIEIKENTSSAIYTHKEVAKEQIRMTSHIAVYDSSYNHIGSKCLDTYSTYESCDEMPYSVVTAKSHARDSVIQELAQASALAIKAIIIDTDQS